MHFSEYILINVKLDLQMVYTNTVRYIAKCREENTSDYVYPFIFLRFCCLKYMICSWKVQV